MTFSLVILGAPRTKKTHNQLVPVKGKMVLLPSIQWRRWTQGAVIVVLQEGRRFDYTFVRFRKKPPHRIEGDRITLPGFPFLGLHPLTTERVRCAATFYRDRNAGDTVGYYQGLADLLEKRGVLANDKQIIDWAGSELRKDTKHPRTELTLHVLES